MTSLNAQLLLLLLLADCSSSLAIITELSS